MSISSDNEQQIAEEFNCVRIQHILKAMPDGKNVMHHLDSIFNQVSVHVGPFARVTIFKTAKKTVIENDTIGFVQLQDSSQHRNLALYLDGYNFHGKQLAAQLANFEFTHIGELYSTSPVKCNECDRYTEDLDEYWYDIQMKAVERALNNVNIHINRSERKKTANVTPRSESQPTSCNKSTATNVPVNLPSQLLTIPKNIIQETSLCDLNVATCSKALNVNEDTNSIGITVNQQTTVEETLGESEQA